VSKDRKGTGLWNSKPNPKPRQENVNWEGIDEKFVAVATSNMSEADRPLAEQAVEV
jgi:hypothetical protein